MKRITSFLSVLLIALVESIGLTIIIPLITPLFYSTQGVLGSDVSQSARGLWFSSVLTSYTVAMFFGSIFLGSISDNYGRKKTLLFCLLGTMIGTLFSVLGVLYKSPSFLLVGRGVDGLTAAVLSLCRSIVADLSSDGKVGKRMSILITSIMLGFFIGPILGSYIYRSYGLIATVSLVGFGAAFNFILITFFFQETCINQVDCQSISAVSFVSIFRKLSKYPSITKLIIINMLASSVIFLTVYFMPILLHVRFSFSTVAISKIFIILALSCLLGAIAYGFIFKRIDSIKKIYLSFFFSASFLTLFTNSYSYQYFLLLAVGSNIFMGFGFVALNTAFSEQASKNHQGWVMGMNSASSALSYSIASICSGGLILIGVNYVYYASIIIAFTMFFITYLYNWEINN